MLSADLKSWKRFTAKLARRCVEWAEIDGRKYHVVGGRVSHAVKNATFDPIEATAGQPAPRQTLVRRFGPDEAPRARAVAADDRVALVVHPRRDALDTLVEECNRAELSLLIQG